MTEFLIAVALNTGQIPEYDLLKSICFVSDIVSFS